MDLTEHMEGREDNATPDDVVREIRERVHQRTRLTCSAGIAPNRMLAKIASEVNKPNNQFAIPPDRAFIMSFLARRKARCIPGIGQVTEALLGEALGITLIHEILDRAPEIVMAFQPKTVENLFSSALGLGRTRHSETEWVQVFGKWHFLTCILLIHVFLVS